MHMQLCKTVAMVFSLDPFLVAEGEAVLLLQCSRQTSWSGRAQSQRKGGTKVDKIFADQNWHFIATKIMQF